MRLAKKRIAAFLLAAMLLPVLAACGTAAPPAETEDTLTGTAPGSDFSETDEPGTDAPEDAGLELVKNGRLLYRVIRSSTGSEEEFSAVSKVISTLREAGVAVQVSEDVMSRADAAELIIGWTVNAPEAREVQETLRYQDYCWKKIGNKIVVTARNQTAFDSCIIAFVRKLLVGTTDGKEGKNVSIREQAYQAKYPLSSLVVDGVPFDNSWKIVYPAQGDSAISYIWSANYWRQILGEQTGFIPEVTDDPVAADGKSILLMPEDGREQMTYRAAMKNGRLTVSAGGIYSAGKAADEVLRLAREQKGQLTSDFSCEGSLMTMEKRPLSAGSDLRVMSANILAEIWGEGPIDERVEIFTANVRFWQPDIIGIQEVTPTWVRALREAFPDGSYQVVSEKRPDGGNNFSCILYNTKTLELVSNGCKPYSESDNKRCRNMGWGVFRIRATGKEFGFISTHWNLGRNMVMSHGEDLWAFIDGELSDHGKRSVISVGDYNTGEYGDYFKHLLQISTLQNLKRVTQLLVNDIGTEKGLGVVPTTSHPTIDFILGTKDTTCQLFMGLDGNGAADMTDHTAQIADVTVS